MIKGKTDDVSRELMIMHCTWPSHRNLKGNEGAGATSLSYQHNLIKQTSKDENVINLQRVKLMNYTVCYYLSTNLHAPLISLHFGGKDPSPPLHFGDGPTTSSPTPPLFFTISFHFSGVMAIMLNACTGPLEATSSFKMVFTSRWRAIGVRASLNLSDMTITLKCVSDPAGLCSN